MRFAKVRLSCLGCRTPLPPGTSDLCKHCRHKVAPLCRAQVMTIVFRFVPHGGGGGRALHG